MRPVEKINVISSCMESPMMRTVRLLSATFTTLSLAFLFVTPVKAAPFAGASAPTVHDNVVTVVRRCWYRSSGRLVCAYGARPYYAPYRYSCRRSHYYPRYYARPYVYRPYTYYSQPYYGPTYAPAPYYSSPYYPRPYYQNQFYLEYNRLYRIYEGPVYVNPW